MNKKKQRETAARRAMQPVIFGGENKSLGSFSRLSAFPFSFFIKKKKLFHPNFESFDCREAKLTPGLLAKKKKKKGGDP